MSKIETLTDDERFGLEIGHSGRTVGAKALRIIDHLTAALEAERAKREHSASDWKVLVEAAESRAEALQARTAELEAELKAERDRRVEHRQMNQSLNEQVQRLEAKCYKAAAALMDAHAATHAAESELADLRGRVERAKEALVSAPVSLDGRIARALEALRGR